MTKQEMIAKLKEAMDMANNRWSEWGERAIATQEILDSILFESVDEEASIEIETQPPSSGETEAKP